MHIQLFVPALPLLPNKLLGAKWYVRSGHAKKWLRHIRVALSTSHLCLKEPPFKKSIITLVRKSPRACDFDGLVGSFKPILDALVQCRVIEDDSLRHINAKYEWSKAPAKDQGVSITVEKIMTQEIYLLIGVPASGKSWVCERAKAKYSYISHDAFIGAQEEYLKMIMEEAAAGSKPVLIETPFSMSKIMDPLTKHGHRVTPIFLIEEETKLNARWEQRGTDLKSQKGHRTRQDTFISRANEGDFFIGNSLAVLNHLNMKASELENEDD